MASARRRANRHGGRRPSGRVRNHHPDGVVLDPPADPDWLDPVTAAGQAPVERRPKNVASKVARYLLDHPDQHVHVEDMASTLGFSRRQIQDAISVTLLSRNGFPVDTIIAGHVYMYRSGSALRVPTDPARTGPTTTNSALAGVLAAALKNADATGPAVAPAPAAAPDPVAQVDSAVRQTSAAIVEAARGTPIAVAGAVAKRVAEQERARMWEPLGSTEDGGVILRDPHGQMWKAVRL